MLGRPLGWAKLPTACCVGEARWPVACFRSMLERPRLRGLLPFVRTTYVRPTSYVWEDGDGVKHQIHQAEGGEQGDPLMPLLFCLAIHDALANVQSRLRPGECIFAFLDDVYAVTSPGRSRAVYNLLAEQLWAVAGIRLHTGKTRACNRAAERPDMDDLGNEVWNPEGIKILGTPVGSQVPSTRGWRTKRSCGMPFHGSRTCSRVGRSSSSAQVPRCHHLLRTLPPSQSAHTRLSTMRACRERCGHCWETSPVVIRRRRMRPDWPHSPCAWVVWVSRAAVRMAPAAYWASWADALPMLQERLPVIAQNAVNVLDGDANVDGCLGGVRQAAAGLDREGFIGRPQWGALQMGAKQPPPTNSEPGEWAHGWQHYAASASEFHFWKSAVFAQSCPSHQAHLRSHSDSGCSHVLRGCPHQTRVQD